MHSRLLVAKFVVSVVHEPGLPVAPSRPCFLLHPTQLLPSKALWGNSPAVEGKQLGPCLCFMSLRSMGARLRCLCLSVKVICNLANMGQSFSGKSCGLRTAA